MKVDEFVRNYIQYVNYAEDRKMLKKYANEELVAYAAAGTSISNTRWYRESKIISSAMVFETARLTVAFIDGRRADLSDAIQFIQNVKMDIHAPEENMAALRKKALFEAI